MPAASMMACRLRQDQDSKLLHPNPPCLMSESFGFLRRLRIGRSGAALPGCLCRRCLIAASIAFSDPSGWRSPALAGLRRIALLIASSSAAQASATCDRRCQCDRSSTANSSASSLSVVDFEL